MTSPVPERVVVPRGRHKANLWWLLSCAVFVAGGVYVMVQLLSLRATLDGERASQSADSTAITRLSDALETTRSQLQQHGVKPSAPPATTIIQGVAGAQGPAGQSIVGPQGPPGKDAPTPNPAAIASQAAALIHPSPGPQGPSGPAGQPGTNSTVPGPQGPAGPQGQTGPAPSSWTWTWTDSTGTVHTYSCTQDTAGGTTYTCKETGTSSPSPSPSPSAPTQEQQAVMNSTQGKSSRTSGAVHSTGPR